MAMTINLPAARCLAALLLGLSLGTSPVWAADIERDDDYPYRTVLTLAPDGSWGTATDSDTGLAIAAAIHDCKAMSRRVTSCGAKFTTVFKGWSLAVLCGDETIIAAARQRAEAERLVVAREAELRLVYRRDMPPCVRVATVGPDGAAVAPNRETAQRP
jgi:hypothetical protein